MVTIGEKVTVAINDFMNAAFKCPTCRMSCDATVVNRHGQKVTKCWQCGQKLIKESGEWKTLNQIVREAGIYKEAAHGPVENPVIVTVKEMRYIEGMHWQCPNCESQNETKIPEKPIDMLMVKGELVSGTWLRCWGCSLFIQNTEDEATWEVFQEGRLVKSKPVEKPLENNVLSNSSKKYWD